MSRVWSIHRDKDGKVAIEPQFESAGKFDHGKALVVPKITKEKYPGENLRLIDRSGKIIPTGDTIFQRQCNGYYIASRPNTGRGILNSNLQWVLKPEFSLVLPRMDGTFFVNQLQDKKASVYSSTGQELGSMSFSELESRRMFYNCIPKSQYKPVSDWRSDSLISTRYVYEQPGSIAVTPDGLVGFYISSVFIGIDGQINVPTSSAFAAKIYPRIVEAQCEPDRYVVSNIRGTGGFDSTRWDEIGRTGAPPLPPTKSFLPAYYGSRLDLFSRFLHEYNLIGMSRDEVDRLLGGGDSSAHTSLLTNRYTILYGGDCGDAYVWVYIDFQDDRVHDWYFSGGGSAKSRSFTEDVVICPETFKVSP